MTRGYVYIFTNEAMPGIVKIGHTGNISQRLNDLSKSTAVPVKFECHFAIEVDDCKEVERKLHKGLEDVRVGKNREFFRIAPERVKFLLQLTNHAVYKPAEKEDREIDQAAIAKRLNLKAAGLVRGDTLTFTSDLRTISVSVYNNSSVLLDGIEMSLAKATETAFHQIGDKWRTGSAAEFWFFNEEILSEKILKSDPSHNERSFTFTDTFPIIAGLISKLNQQSKGFASHRQIVDCLIEDPDSRNILEISLQLSRFQTIKEVAANQVAWWSQQITQGINPYRDRFDRRKTKTEPYEYWDLELGASPERTN